MTPTIKQIQERTAEICGVELTDILSARQGPRSNSPLLRARHIAMFVARHLTPQSLPAIGRAFDRDHTTVLHAVRKVDQLVYRDQDLYRDVQMVFRSVVNRDWHSVRFS